MHVAHDAMDSSVSPQEMLRESNIWNIREGIFTDSYDWSDVSALLKKTDGVLPKCRSTEYK